MPSPRQIKAARALVGWEATELAKRTGLSRVTIANIEASRTHSQEASMKRIVDALTGAGVEFLDNHGVRLRPASIDTLTGREGLQQFFNNVHEHASKHGGVITMFGIDETTFIKTIGEEFSRDYLGRMTEVARNRKDLQVRSIICEGDTNFCAATYNKYRWMPKDLFEAVPFYIYGETLAIMDFETKPAPTIMLIKSRAITKAYRKQFETFWKIARNPFVAKNANNP